MHKFLNHRTIKSLVIPLIDIDTRPYGYTKGSTKQKSRVKLNAKKVEINWYPDDGQ